MTVSLTTAAASEPNSCLSGQHSNPFQPSGVAYIYDSPKYDSVDWAYYYDDVLLEATTTNYQDFNDDDFDGDWD